MHSKESMLNLYSFFDQAKVFSLINMAKIWPYIRVYQKVKHLQKDMILYKFHPVFNTRRNFIGGPKG